MFFQVISPKLSTNSDIRMQCPHLSRNWLFSPMPHFLPARRGWTPRLPPSETRLPNASQGFRHWVSWGFAFHSSLGGLQGETFLVAKHRSATQKQSGLLTLCRNGERGGEGACCPWRLHQGPGHPGGCSVLKTVKMPQEMSLKMPPPKGCTDLPRKRTVKVTQKSDYLSIFYFWNRFLNLFL